MKHLEHFNHWYDRILNSWPFCLDDSKIHSIGIAWLFQEQAKWRLLPRLVPADWQYANAIFFVRMGYPFSLFFSIRNKKYLLQGGIGWKQTGRFAIHFRLQTDASASVGYHAGLPNNGQASGFEYGRH